jgi:hypothetical protein
VLADCHESDRSLMASVGVSAASEGAQ